MLRASLANEITPALILYRLARWYFSFKFSLVAGFILLVKDGVSRSVATDNTI